MPAGAQVVRGITRDAVTGLALQGVLVTVRSGDRVWARGLSGEDGGFVLPEPPTRPAELVAEMIGYGTVVHTFPPPATGIVVLTPEPIELDALEVGVSRRCRLDAADAAPLIALWDEARKALRRAAFSRESARLRFEVATWERTLEPGTLSIREEQSQELRHFGAAPFDGIDSRRLEESGFAQEEQGTLTYFAPDEAALLSDGFLRTHCLTLVVGESAPDGLVGLAFEPAPGRSVPEVEGTAWLDATTAALRSVDFRFVNLRRAYDTRELGGHVEFQALPSGDWMVERWWIRVPVEVPGIERETVLPGAPRSGVRLQAIHETGGEVRSVSLSHPSRWAVDAVVTGSVRDSATAEPVAGVVVALVGTDLEARTDSAGHFRITGVRPGSYQVEVRDSLVSVTLPLARVRVGEGDLAMVHVEAQALRAQDLWLPELPQPHGSVHGTVVSAGGVLEGAEVRMADSLVATTDGDGHFSFLRVPAGAVVLETRYLGFVTRLDTVAVVPEGLTDVLVPMDPVLTLEPIVVRVYPDPAVIGGFYRRRLTERGVFLTRAEFMRDRPSRFTDILREIPGVRLYCEDVHCWPVMRGSTPSRLGDPLSGERCPVMVYLDGTPQRRDLSLDALLSPARVEAVEVYRRLGEVPSRFADQGARCGVILIWTRR
jgi:hypothetical protein